MSQPLDVHEVDVAAERNRRKRRITLISVISVFAVAGALALSWYLIPPAFPDTIDEAKALVNSSKFQNLSKKQKQPYMDVIREQFGSLDDETRRKMMAEDEALRNAMREGWRDEMQARANAWALATPAERDAMMDEPRGERPPRPEGEGGGPPAGAAMQSRMNENATNGNSQSSAAFAEMMKARRDRRERQ